MFKLKLLCSVSVHAFMLLTLLGANAAQAYEDQNDVPTLPNRGQFVLGSTSVGSESSLSASTTTGTMAARGLPDFRVFTDMDEFYQQ